MGYTGGTLTYREFMQRAAPFKVREIETKNPTSKRQIERLKEDGSMPWATVPHVIGEGQRELERSEIKAILRRLEFSEEEMSKF